MSGKKPRASHSSEEPAPRPIALLLAVAFAAGISTWHWYRPLPPKATTVSNGPFVAQVAPSELKGIAPLKSKWKDSGLIFPSDAPSVDTGSVSYDELSANPTRNAEDPNSDSSLTGNSELSLEPFREATQPAKHTISQFPLPMIPVRPIPELAPSSPSESRLWTVGKTTTEIDPSSDQPSTESQTKPTNLSAESPSPFRVPQVKSSPRTPSPVVTMTSNIWPDLGFDPRSTAALPRKDAPETAASPNSATNGSDGVLSLSSNRIRTLDHESQPPAPAPTVTQKLRAITPAAERGANMPRTGSVIRQPSAKPLNKN